MTRQPVASSNLASIGYDPIEAVLEIEFRNGSIYQYFNVPSQVHSALMAASSHGSFFHRVIRNTYIYRQIR